MPHATFDECIRSCEACAVTCEHCATSCLGEKDVAMMAACIRLDRDCADACRFAALLMSRGSPFAAEFCELCAKFCEACATECAKHQAEHCQACAKACRECAAACRHMAGPAHSHGQGAAARP
jgi:hypothetical protein